MNHPFMTPEMEVRRMAAVYAWGAHAKALVKIASGDGDPHDVIDGGSVRKAIQEMRRPDLEDAYAMLLEALVLDGDLLGPFYVGRPGGGGGPDAPDVIQQLTAARSTIKSVVREFDEAPDQGVKGEIIEPPTSISVEDCPLVITVNTRGRISVQASSMLPFHEVRRLLTAIGAMAEEIEPLGDDEA